MTEETARSGTPAAPFAEVWPRSKERDKLFLGLAERGSHWRLALGALYIATGRFIPADAKRLGCFFGFCNKEGVLQPMRDTKATHLGWTLDGPHTPTERESIRAALKPWRIEDTDGWGQWCVTLAWPGDREQAEGWGADADEALNMATARLFAAGWRAGMTAEDATRLLAAREEEEGKEAGEELAALLRPDAPLRRPSAAEAAPAARDTPFDRATGTAEAAGGSNTPRTAPAEAPSSSSRSPGGAGVGEARSGDSTGGLEP